MTISDCIQLIVVGILAGSLYYDMRKYNKDKDEIKLKQDLKMRIYEYRPDDRQMKSPDEYIDILKNDNKNLSDQQIRNAIYEMIAEGTIELVNRNGIKIRIKISSN